MTNVLHFIGSVGDGGAESLIRDYVKNIDKSRFRMDVAVLFATENAGNTKLLRQYGVEPIVLYPHDNIFTHFINKYFGIVTSLKLLAVLRRRKIDAMHIHLDCIKHTKRIAPFIKSVKLFYTIHSEPRFYFNKGNERGDAARYLIRHNDLRIIALHDEAAQIMRKDFGISNVHVIHNAIDLERFRNVECDRLETRAELGIPKDAFVVGHVGRFDEAKNQSFLVDVFLKIRQRRAEAFLLMIGNGAMLEPVREKLEAGGQNGHYAILSHRSDVPRLMQTMDVFVFPSKYEGLPVVMIEAQAVGLPCVMSGDVPHEAARSSRVKILSLSAPVEEWADAALDKTLPESTEEPALDSYDMSKEIKRLEAMYLSE